MSAATLTANPVPEHVRPNPHNRRLGTLPDLIDLGDGRTLDLRDGNTGLEPDGPSLSAAARAAMDLEDEWPGYVGRTDDRTDGPDLTPDEWRSEIARLGPDVSASADGSSYIFAGMGDRPEYADKHEWSARVHIRGHGCHRVYGGTLRELAAAGMAVQP